MVLLLFEVGIEVDLGRLRKEQATLLWAAPLQTVVTFAIAAGALIVAGLDLSASALLGLAVALSSSVVIVNITRSRRRTTDPTTDHVLVGWAVLQDVTGVSIAIILLTLMGSGRPPLESLVGLVAFGALTLGAARLLPLALVQLRSEHDLFLLVSVAAGLALAGAGAVLAGIPIALAAFIAGLAITDSPDAAEARRRLLSFRDVFAVFFFVAIGTLIDPAAVGRGLPWLALALGLVFIAKSALAYGLVRFTSLHGSPLHIAVGLGQMGEFSFVLASFALARGASVLKCSPRSSPQWRYRSAHQRSSCGWCLARLRRLEQRPISRRSRPAVCGQERLPVALLPDLTHQNDLPRDACLRPLNRVHRAASASDTPWGFRESLRAAIPHPSVESATAATVVNLLSRLLTGWPPNSTL